MRKGRVESKSLKEQDSRLASLYCSAAGEAEPWLQGAVVEGKSELFSLAFPHWRASPSCSSSLVKPHPGPTPPHLAALEEALSAPLERPSAPLPRCLPSGLGRRAEWIWWGLSAR